MTDNAREITLPTIPSMTSMLLRAATTRKKPQNPPQFTPLCVRATGITVDRQKLEKFNRVCGFENSDTIPLPYPHIMAFALHMQLMLEPNFPFAPMGAVHVRNTIRQQRALRCDEALDFAIRLGETQQVEKGYEVSLVTEVRVDNALVWDDVSVMLIRKGGSGVKKEKAAAGDPIQYSESLQWELAPNKGREYAAASGDYNPIHLYPITAKLMGFKRQIMHGMWSKSRSVAQLLPAQHSGPASAEVAFKLPIFLPSTVTLLYNSDDSGSQFEMKDAEGVKPHIAGSIALGVGISDTLETEL